MSSYICAYEELSNGVLMIAWESDDDLDIICDCGETDCNECT